MAKRTTGIVSATKLADHLAMSRTYLDRLVSEGVIKRRDDGRFDLDRCRVDYLRHLRQAKRASVNGEARAQYDKAKARLTELRVAKLEGSLMEVDDALDATDQMVGLFLTGIGELGARCFPRDIALRRVVEHEARELQGRIAASAREKAKQYENPG
jgi:hypothetical protein